MKINLKIFSYSLALVFGLFLGVLAVHAADTPGITFPVAELGNCKNKTECKVYCDQKDHIQACIDFAKSHGLMSSHEADKAQKLRQLPEGGGPGGCKDVDACKAYCQATEHARECIQFAQEHGLMDQKEVDEAKKILALLEQRGIKMPGGCTSKQLCEAYCHDQAHFDECLNFAKSAGFITDEQAQAVKKTQGQGPGGCRGEECKTYCAAKEHFQECLTFAKDHGFITDKEQAQLQKTQGNGPGGCKDEASCREFCGDPAHRQECTDFATAHGLIDEQSKNQPTNQNFLVKPGETPISQGIRQLPEPVVACMRQTIGEEQTNTFLNTSGEPSAQMRDKMRACYDEWSKQLQQQDIKQKQEQSAYNPNIGDQGKPNPSNLTTPKSFIIPETVMACLRQSLGEETAQKVAQGQTNLEGDLKVKMQVCFAKVNEQKTATPPPPTSSTGSGVCIQALTPARNPENNTCRVFPSPCVVPMNWVKVTRCESTTPQTQPPVPPVPPPTAHPDQSSSSTLQRFGATLISTLYFFVGKPN